MITLIHKKHHLSDLNLIAENRKRMTAPLGFTGVFDLGGGDDDNSVPSNPEISLSLLWGDSVDTIQP